MGDALGPTHVQAMTTSPRVPSNPTDAIAEGDQALDYGYEDDDPGPAVMDVECQNCGTEFDEMRGECPTCGH